MTGGATRERLLQRKRDLYQALDTLERDMEAGAIDPGAYRATRDRYESEAAGVLEQLDALPQNEARDALPRTIPKGALLSGALLVVAVGIALLLVSALRPRGTIGARMVVAKPAVPAAIARAAAQVTRHPGDLGALVALGRAYLSRGDLRDADAAFRRAMTVAPVAPEPATLHAMVLSSTGRTAGALAVLRTVETAAPRYTRAWLLDGLVSARTPATRQRAVTSLKRVLQLRPGGTIAATVRTLLARLEPRR